MERLTPQRQPLAAFMVLLILRDSMHIPCMVAQLTLDTLGDAATRALGPRLVALLLYGSAARGTHVVLAREVELGERPQIEPRPLGVDDHAGAPQQPREDEQVAGDARPVNRQPPPP